MTKTLIYILLIIPIVAVTDALRDRWRSAYLDTINMPFLAWKYLHKVPAWIIVIDHWKAGGRINYLLTRPWPWWRWHIVKWINLYSPHVFIVYLLWHDLKWYEIALSAGLMFFVWRRIYNYRQQ